MQGKDGNGRKFSISHPYHIYNLDFCNNLVTPNRYYNKITKKWEKYYKLETIGKLLEYQRDTHVSKEDNKFIMFLTVHYDFLEKEMNRHSFDGDSAIQDYVKKIDSITDETQRKIRLLKAYTYHFVSNQFRARGFISEFLSPVFYKGSGEHWLLMFYYFRKW